MSVKKDNKTNKWYCRVSFKDHEGKYRTKTKKGFSTKKEAQLFEANLKEELEHVGSLSQIDVTLADYFENWVTRNKLGRYSISTERKYLTDIKLIKSHFKQTKLKDITRSMYQDFINERGKGHGKDVVQKTHTHVSACVKNALADGLIAKDFTFNVELRFDNESNTNIKVWNETESKLLIEHFKSHQTDVNTMLYLAITTGLRIGEIYALDWSDITSETLTVKRGYDYGYTKDFTNAKNSFSHRTIAISSETYAYLQRYRLKYRKIRPKYLFLNNHHQPAVSHNTVLKHLRKICDDLNITKLTPHALRHTHCSLLLAQGMPIQFISKRLGHASINETLRTYSHLIDEYEQVNNTEVKEILNQLEILH